MNDHEPFRRLEKLCWLALGSAMTLLCVIVAIGVSEML